MLTDTIIDTKEMTKDELLELFDKYKKAYEEVTRKPRAISDLLKLDTYQDMTDAEIALLLEYKIKVKMTEYISMQENAEFERMRMERLKEIDASFKVNSDVIQSLLAQRPTLIEKLEGVTGKWEDVGERNIAHSDKI